MLRFSSGITDIVEKMKINSLKKNNIIFFAEKQFASDIKKMPSSKREWHLINLM